MRKFWFVYLAKALIVFPGGFGTMDELFEVVTLNQTEKLTKRLPVVLFGDEYWRNVVDFDALVEYGTISASDLDIMYRTDSVDDAFDFITKSLSRRELKTPGGWL
jgi:predicted Rossmann-fold nucleotide-binding protein